VSAVKYIVIGVCNRQMPEGNRRDDNRLGKSSFTSKELSCCERSCIVLVVL
jgi:hypothetical protein